MLSKFLYILNPHNLYKRNKNNLIMANTNIRYDLSSHEFGAINPSLEIMAIIRDYTETMKANPEYLRNNFQKETPRNSRIQSYMLN